MKKSSLKKLIESTTKSVKILKEKVERLKESREVHNLEKGYDQVTHENEKNTITVHFSPISVAKATIVVLLLLLLSKFVQEIGTILILFFISILFAAALDPTVDYFEKKKIPRSVSILCIYILLLAVLTFFISQLIPLVAKQLIELARSISDLILNLANNETQNSLPVPAVLQSMFGDFIHAIDKELVISKLKSSIESFGGQLQSFAGNTVGVLISVFSGILNFFIVLILTFFLVVDEKGVDEFFISLFPSRHDKYIIEKTEAIKHKVGYWLRGQIILMFVMFILTWIALSIIGVNYALTLAMIAGIAEIIPVMGPIIAGVPAILVAFNQSPWMSLSVLIMIIILQQAEGNLIVPIVMKKAVGLSPIIVILAMLIGYASLGVLGAVIAVPVATSLAIFVNDYASKKK